MAKVSYRIIAYIPVFVMYFGFPLIRDVLPFHQDYSYEDWMALGGIYAVGALIASPFLYLLIKASNDDSKFGLHTYKGGITATALQFICLYSFWSYSVQLYISMAICMVIMSVIYSYTAKKNNLILDKDTGSLYRVRGYKAYRLEDEELERSKADIAGRNIQIGVFSSSSISGFDGNSSVIPVSFSSTSSSTDCGYNSGIIINPSSGMPMVGGVSGLDIHGNSWGTNFNEPSNTYDPNRGY
jgi:hypothetical protein